jgi:hypothetical protein
LAWPAFLFLAGWAWETVETFVILSVLGAGLGLGQVLSFETLLTIVRSLVVVVPSGLGVQDVGYLVFLRGYGVPDAVTLAAAFLVVKRAKETFWVAVGYLLFLLPMRRRGDASLPDRRRAFPEEEHRGQAVPLPA